MQRLVDICDAATFGLNHEDVLDVSYRSAWKLDPVYFASKLNILHAGLMDSIRYNLLRGNQGRMTFYAELYKLNVYGEFVFALPFRIEESTSRRKGFFLQTAQGHPAGRQDVRIARCLFYPPRTKAALSSFDHGDEEWKFESDTVPLSSISYAAFYGDVEHEVTEVKSGYRLTLTYNLYFGGSLDSQAIVSTPTSDLSGSIHLASSQRGVVPRQIIRTVV